MDVDGIAEGYVFKANNPFMDDLHSFAKAKSLFRHGILSEAVYALEAEVSPANDTCFDHYFSMTHTCLLPLGLALICAGALIPHVCNCHTLMS